MNYRIVLHCIQGKDQGKKWKLHFTAHTTVVIGRLEGCHVLLNDSKVSQSHCLLQIQNNQLCLIDMGSSYGTQVNAKEMISPYALSDKEKISLGETVLEIEFISPPLHQALTKEPEEKETSDVAQEADEPQTSFLDNSFSLPTEEQEQSTHQFVSDTSTSSLSTQKLCWAGCAKECEQCQQLQSTLTALAESKKKQLAIKRVNEQSVVLRAFSSSSQQQHLYHFSRISNQPTLAVSPSPPVLTHYLLSTHEVWQFRGHGVVVFSYQPGTFLSLAQACELEQRKKIALVISLGEGLREGQKVWGAYGGIAADAIFHSFDGRFFLYGYGVSECYAPPAFSSDFLSLEVRQHYQQDPYLLDFLSLLALMYYLLVQQSIFSFRATDSSLSPLWQDFFSSHLLLVEKKQQTSLQEFLDLLKFLRKMH